MMDILSNIGLSGIGMYWIIIELLHQQPDGKMSYENFKRYLSFYTKSEGRGTALGEEIEHVFIKSKLLLKKNGFVMSNRVLLNKRLRQELSEKRSLAGKKSAEVRLGSRIKTKRATSDEQNPTHVEQGKEKKRKERKVDPAASGKRIGDVVGELGITN